VICWDAGSHQVNHCALDVWGWLWATPTHTVLHTTADLLDSWEQNTTSKTVSCSMCLVMLTWGSASCATGNYTDRHWLSADWQSALTNVETVTGRLKTHGLKWTISPGLKCRNVQVKRSSSSCLGLLLKLSYATLHTLNKFNNIIVTYLQLKC